MSAFVSVAAGAVPAEDLRAALSAAGVVRGVDEALLDELVESAGDAAFSRGELQIAWGQAPTAPVPGRVELCFDAGLSPGRLSADGHMDYFERGLLKPVAPEQPIATLFAPRAGVPGFCVDGRALGSSAGAPPFKLKLGPGVVVDAQGEVRARQGGVVLFKPGESLDVVSSHVHRGAVDLRSGHLDMQGSLTVRGDVERLLEARATGDLEVLGSVSGGSLRAGGSIRVSGSVRGSDTGRVSAEHDVAIKSCESAEVTAGGVLRVQEAVSSQLRGQHVVVTGRLRGGGAVAERGVVIKEAGTTTGTATLVQAGEPLEPPPLEAVQRAVLMQKLRRMAERGGVREAFGSRGDARAKGGKLGRLEASESAQQLRERTARAVYRGQLERAAVIELGLAHPGVELRIGGARLSIERTERGLRYTLDAETGRLASPRTVA